MKSRQSAMSQFRSAYLLLNIDLASWNHYKALQLGVPKWWWMRKKYNKRMRRSAAKLLNHIGSRRRDNRP